MAKGQPASTEGRRKRVQFDGMAGMLARAAAVGAIILLVGILLSGRFW